MALKTDILQSTVDKIGKAVGDYLAGLALFFTNIKNAVTDGFNASNGLKEGGKVDIPQSKVFDLNSMLLLAQSNAQVISALSQSGSTPTTVVADAENTFGAGLVLRPGRVGIITSVTFTMDGKGQVSMQGTSDGGGSGWSTWLGAVPPFNKNIYASFGVNGGSITYNFPSGLYLPEAYAWYFRYKSSDTNSRVAAISVTYHELSSHFKPDAKYNILLTGDSTTWYPMGLDANGRSYMGKWLWPQQVADLLLKNDGIIANVISRSYGGALSTDTYYNLETGAYRNINWDLQIVSIGHNDASNAGPPPITPEVKYKESLKAHILERNRLNPGKPILFLAPTTTDSSTRPLIATYRQYVKDVALDATIGGIANNVYFYDQSQAYGLGATPATDTNFSSAERSSGNRLHPSGLGHTLIASNINGDVDNGIAAGQQSGVYGVLKKYKSQIFK